MTKDRLLRRATCLVILPCFLMVATGCAQTYVVQQSHVAKARVFEKQGMKDIRIPAKTFYYVEGKQMSVDYALRWKKIEQISPRDNRTAHADVINSKPGVLGAGVVAGGLGLAWMLTSPLFFCDENYQNCTNEAMMWSVTGALMGLGIALITTGLVITGPVSRGDPNPLRW